MPDIMGIYRIPVAGTAEYRVYVQDFDGAEWSLTPHIFRAAGVSPRSPTIRGTISHIIVLMHPFG